MEGTILKGVVGEAPSGASDVAQQVKVAATKTSDLSLLPGTLTKERTDFCRLTSDQHACMEHTERTPTELSPPALSLICLYTAAHLLHPE